MIKIERYPIAINEDQYKRQKHADQNTTWIADNLKKFFYNQSFQSSHESKVFGKYNPCKQELARVYKLGNVD